jgi:Tfp pilus assembly protein PilV
MGASGRGAVRDVTPAAFYFTTRDYFSISDKAAFFDRAGVSRAAASANLTRSRSPCSSRYSIGSEQGNLVGVLGFVR